MSENSLLSPLQARWLAEIVRRHEEQRGALEDSAAVARARSAPAELEARILQRADSLAAREGWREAVQRWMARARLCFVLAAVLAFVLGFGAAAGVLGDGTRPLNVVWAVTSLLGVHLLSLLLWLIAMSAHGGSDSSALFRRGGVLGRLWLQLVSKLDRSPVAADLPRAIGGLFGRGRLAGWALGAVNHALWMIALAGAATGVLLLLMTRRYGFVWETTILPAQAFVTLSGALGSVPALLGFPVPDAATILASGDAPMLDEAGRRAWSGWLLGVLLVYGVGVRAVLALLCTWRWRQSTRGLQLDLARPGYARLRPRLLPASERLGVQDPAPDTGWSLRRARPPAPRAGVATLVALELGDDLPWPPLDLAGERFAAEDGGRIDSREQRRAVLARFAAQPPSRLLVVVDARSTPDRGTLGLLTELASLAAETRVWARAGAGHARLPLWRAGALAAGVDAAAVFDDGEAARAWVEGEASVEAG